MTAYLLWLIVASPWLGIVGTWWWLWHRRSVKKESEWRIAENWWRRLTCQSPPAVEENPQSPSIGSAQGTGLARVMRRDEGRGDSRRSEAPPDASRLRYILDSTFLAAAIKYVGGRSIYGPHRPFREIFVYAAGMELAPGIYILSHLVPVRFAEQTAAHVRVADQSNIQKLAAIDEAGLTLTAHFHTHGVRGTGAIKPSFTDRNFQRRLETAGHICIGGICSLDGFVRFFSHDGRRFDVEIRGSNVERIDECTFRVAVASDNLPVTLPVRL